MKKTFVYLALLCLALLAAGCDRTPRGAQIDSPAPDFTVVDRQGKTWTLAETKGKVVFLHFWATWCPSCRDELASIQRLYAQLPREQFVTLTVLYNDDPKLAQAMLAQIGASFPVAVDPDGKAARDYGLTGVPETYIIDRQGVLREKLVGAVHWDSPGARQMLGQYLTGKNNN